jgi:hypothetical protein
VLFLGCIGAFVAGVVAGKAMPGLIAAIGAGAGGILLVIFVFFPSYEWTLAMKIALPVCGAVGAATRLLVGEKSEAADRSPVERKPVQRERERAQGAGAPPRSDEIPTIRRRGHDK